MATSETIDIPNYLIGNNTKLFAKKNITSGQTNAIRIYPPKIAYVSASGIVFARYGIFAFIINTDSDGNVAACEISNILTHAGSNAYTASHDNDKGILLGTRGLYDNFLIFLNSQSGGVAISDFTVEMYAQ